MNDRQTVRWGFYLIRDIAKLAAVLLLGNEGWDRIINSGNYDSRRYLKALQKEGWSVKANGSCQVISVRFYDKEDDKGNVIKASALRREFERRYQSVFGTMSPGQSCFHSVKSKKLRRPILCPSSRKEWNVVLIPESEYARAYQILAEMGISHDLDGYPTRKAVSYSFDDQAVAKGFAEDLRKNRIVGKAIVSPDPGEDGRYSVVIPHAPHKEHKGKESLEDIITRYGIDTKRDVVSAEDKINEIIGRQRLYRGESVLDPERGYELSIKQLGPTGSLGRGSRTASVYELKKLIDRYNWQMDREMRPEMKLSVIEIPDAGGKTAELRISHSQKALLDQFTIARYIDIDYYDPKRLRIAFSKDSKTITFSRIEGEPDNTYEFEAYLYANGFHYSYDRVNGRLSVDLSDGHNRDALADMLKGQSDEQGRVSRGFASSFNQSFGEIPEEIHRSGAQQFDFSTDKDDATSEKDFSEWFDANLSEYHETEERSTGSEEEISRADDGYADMAEADERDGFSSDIPALTDPEDSSNLYEIKENPEEEEPELSPLDDSKTGDEEDLRSDIEEMTPTREDPEPVKQAEESVPDERALKHQKELQKQKEWDKERLEEEKRVRRLDEERRSDKGEAFRDTVSEPTHITDPVGGWGNSNAAAVPAGSAYDTLSGSTSSYGDTDRSSNLYETGRDDNPNYGQSQLQKDIDNYEESRVRQEQERAEKAARDQALKDQKLQAEEEKRRKHEEEKRKQDALDARRRREAEEKRNEELRRKANEAGEKERQRQIEERRRNAARLHAGTFGTPMSGVPSSSISAIGNGGAIPDRSADINFDRDYQINRRTVDASRDHLGNAMTSLMSTAVRPVTMELKSNESIRAADHNVVIKTAKDTAKNLIRSAISSEAANLRVADSVLKMQKSYGDFMRYGGIDNGIGKVKKLDSSKLNETNLKGELVSGVSRDVKPLMKDINEAAYSCGFKGFKGISDFNELCKNKGMLEQALRDMKKKGISDEKIRQLKALGSMSKHGAFVKNHMGGSGIKRAARIGLRTPGKTVRRELINTLAQTDSIRVGRNGCRYAYAAAQINDVMLRGGAAALRGSSAAIMRANAALKAAVVRHGSLVGAVRAGGMRFVSGVRKIPGVVKSVPGIVRKAPQKIGRAAKDGVKRAGKRIVARGKRSLPVRMVKGTAKFARGAYGTMRLIRRHGLRGIGAGLRHLGAGMAARLKMGIAKLWDNLKNGLANFGKKILMILKLIGVAFGIFMVQIILIFLTQIGAAAAEAIKDLLTSFDEYRNDVEDPRTDTIMGIASEELKCCDVLYTEGISLFIGGLDSIDSLIERLPFVGKIAHNAAMGGLDALAESGSEDGHTRAYILARSVHYASDMVSTEKSDTGQVGFTYFYDSRVGMTNTETEKREHVTGSNCIWVECDTYPIDDPAGMSIATAEWYTTPQLVSTISEMGSINNSISLQFVDGNGDPCGRMSNIKEILSISSVCFTDSALGHEDFGEDQNYGVSDGETISDKEIMDEATAAGEGESVSGVKGFIGFLGNIGDLCHNLAQWQPLKMLGDVLAEVAEDIMIELIPGFPGFPDISDPGTAFIQSSYCLAAYVASHRIYVGYRADMTTGSTMIINCDDESIPHFGYTDPHEPKKDALDHNACDMQQIYYYRGPAIHVDEHSYYGTTFPAFDFTEGWSITANPSSFSTSGIAASTVNYGNAEWSGSPWCCFINPAYIRDGIHPMSVMLQGGHEVESLQRFLCLCMATYGAPNDGMSGTATYKAYTCYGHPYVIVVAKTYTMHTGLFEMIEKVPFMHAIENVMSHVRTSMFDGQWEGDKHWTENNREWAQWINDGDWEKLYNLYVGNVVGAHYRIPTKLSVSKIMGQLGPQTLSFDRYYLLYKALRTVGQIPYGSATNMTEWIIRSTPTPAGGRSGDGFMGYRYGHDGVALERPLIWVKQDQQGNPELPDHMNNTNYLVWLFASSNLDLLQRSTPPTDSFYESLDTWAIKSQCISLGHGLWAPGDLVSRADGVHGQHMALFLGYDADREYGYVIEEYAYQFDVDERVTTERDGAYPDVANGRYVLNKGFKMTYSMNKPPDEMIINSYGMVYLEKIKISDWYGYRPKCYKLTEPFKVAGADPSITFNDEYDAVEQKRTGRGEWQPSAPGRNTKLYSSADDQQKEYERWGKTH